MNARFVLIRVLLVLLATAGAAVMFVAFTKQAQAAPTACTAGPHSGAISFDQTWCASDNPHLVNGSVSVNGGVTLTIEPGVEIRFATGTSLGVNGSLEAIGSPSQPITFTTQSASPIPGSWDNIDVSGHLNMAYCDVGYGGGWGGRVFYITSSDVQVRHCRIHHALQDAVRVEGQGLTPLFEDVEIDHSGAWPIHQSTVAMNPTYLHMDFHDNGTDALYIDASGANRDVTLDGSPAALGGAPVYWTGGVESGHTLTITAGTTIKLPSGGSINVAGGATLIAEGTQSLPITFTTQSSIPIPGSWDNIDVSGHASLSYCDVGYGGGWGGQSFYITSSDVQVRHCRIHHALQDAVRVEGQGLTPLFEDVEIDHSGAWPIHQSTVAMNPTYLHMDFHDNGTDALYIDASGANRDVTLDGSPAALGGAPVYWTGGVESGHTLTITAGTTIKLPSGGSINVAGGATLIAEGTQSLPITFTTQSSIPIPGSWDNIDISGHASLSYCDVGYGGGWGGRLFYITSSDVQVRHCRIHDTDGTAFVIGASAQPTIAFNQIYDNTAGMTNMSPWMLVSARYNWWGDASGPYHPTLNPSGSGNSVGNAVAFDPWLIQYNWLFPFRDLFHGVETLGWAAAGNGLTSLTASISGTGMAQQLVFGDHFPWDGSLDWDTLAVPNGFYELRVAFFDPADQKVGEVVRQLAVNNSASLAWHSGRITSNETWAAGFVHIVEADVTVASGATLTIDNGAIVKFLSNTCLTVEDGAVLGVLGIEGSPAILTSILDDSVGGDVNLDGNQTVPMPGDWKGLLKQGTGQINLSPYAEVRYILAIHSGVLSGDETWEGTYVHRIAGDVTVPNGRTLIIEAGAIVKLEGGRRIIVQAGGILIAEGNVAQPIVFTSIKDDSAGGDTNQDGDATLPAPGDWFRIQVNGGSATFSSAQFRYGAGTDPISGAFVYVDSNGLATLTDSILFAGLHNGVYSYQGNVTVSNSLITNTDRGIHSYLGAFVSVVNCTVAENRIGVDQHGGTISVANSLVTHNSEIGVWHSYGPDLLTIRYSDVWNPGAINYGNTPDRTSQDGNLSVDPDYVDRLNANYRLDYTSLVIDAADGGLSPVQDLMGAPRYDDPRTPNTGLPTSGGAYADMGAYEFVETAESPIDLVVNDVHGPLSVMAGELVTVTWTVVNNGPPQAKILGGDGSSSQDPSLAVGPWHDAIYLVYRGEAVLAGEILVGLGVTLGPGESHTFQAQVRVPGSVVGEHQWQVMVNIRNEVFEGQNRNNNITLSPASVKLDLPELLVDGSPLMRQFAMAGESHWFKLRPNSSVDVLLSLDLAGTGITELYIGQGYMPSLRRYDARSTEWRVGDVTALIYPGSSQVFYIMAFSRTLSGATNFTIQADALDFSLTSVDQTQIGDAGTATIGIRGGELEEDLIYELVEPGGISHNASQVFFVNPSLVYATFPLDGLPHGAYDVRARRGAHSVQLEDILQVVTAVLGQVEYSLEAPEVIRPDWRFVVSLSYRNPGNTDVMAPWMFIEAVGAVFVRMHSGSTGDANPPIRPEFTSMHLLGISAQGPAGILPPGAGHQIHFTLRPTIPEGYIDVNLYSVGEEESFVEWPGLKAALKPNWVPATAWDAIYANFTPGLGATTHQVHQTLAENATYLSRLGIRTHEVFRLMAFELEQAGLAPLSARHTLGAFGYGNFAPWEVTAVTEADGDVTFRSGGQVRWFGLLPGGSYQGGPGDFATLTLVDSCYHLRETNGMLAVFHPDGKLDYLEDLNGNRETVVYSSGQATGILTSEGDGLSFLYNGSGRLIQVVDEIGRVTSFSFNPANTLLTGITFAGETTSFAYLSGPGPALANALQSVTFADGSHLYFDYDWQGRLIRRYRDGGAEMITYAYDSAYGLTISSAFGSSQFLFADFGKVGKFTDALGNVQRFFYDDTHELIQASAGMGITYWLGYDAQGELKYAFGPLDYRLSLVNSQPVKRPLRLTNPKDQKVYYTYDSAYNLTSILFADGRRETFEYDAQGNPIRYTNRRGDVITLTYNSHGMPTRKTYDHGAYLDFIYDSHRNLSAIHESNGNVTSFTYNAIDQLVRITYPNGRYLQFAYDSLGRRVQMVDHSGFTVNYAYDLAGRLASLRDGGNNLIVAYTYDAAGRLIQESQGNGAFTTYAYNATAQLTSLVNYAPGGGVLSRFDYTYDALGRRIGLTTLEGMWSFQYDALERLVGVIDPTGRSIQYRYDANGNRLEVTDDSLVTTYQVNGMDQYTQVGASGFSYDAGGNLVMLVAGTSSWSFTYNADGLLSAMTSPEGSWTFEYDVLGNRIASTFNGQRTEYLVDPFGLGDIVAEYDSGGLVAHYVHGMGLVSRVDAANASAYYGFDGSANTVQITGPMGNLLNVYSYLPFGELRSSSGSLPNPFTFAGKVGGLGNGAGFTWMRNRLYDHWRGRFTQPDPLGYGGNDLNLYAYAFNNPIRYLDPFGFCTIPMEYLANYEETKQPHTSSGLIYNIRQMHNEQLLNYYLRKAPEVLLGVSIGSASQAIFGPGKMGNTQMLEFNLEMSWYPSIERRHEWWWYPEVRWRVLKKIFPRGVVGFAARAAGWGFTVFTVADAVCAWQEVPRNPPTWEIFSDYYLTGDRFKQVIKAQRRILVERSRDPNDILGPNGFGAPHFITDLAPMVYTVRFENAPDASAAAQMVTVTLQLDSNLDWSTFQLVSLGFGDFEQSLPAGLNQYRDRLDFVNEFGLYVDVDIELDQATGLVTWRFVSIDPVTSLPTRDPIAGFLPPNEAPPEGQGYMVYTVQPKSGLISGDTLQAQASIIFDTNEPIATNVWINTLDRDAPTASVQPLPAVSYPWFMVNWTGTDGAGSGIAYYNVYVSVDGGPYSLWLATDQTSAMYKAQWGHTYDFYVLAVDHVGNIQPIPTSAQATTHVDYVLYMPIIKK